ncbi:hypothetical protein [Flavobacterium marginilacus]|uniref:hypothetical protein n=1 Tax=Flavobacterium marginilacus TaxID=3003256 RepID=UPI00248E293D|nr:hypothetical protein [Flavobacterium marginilacus]
MNNFNHFQNLFEVIKDHELNYNSDTEIISIKTNDISKIENFITSATKINEGVEFSINNFDYLFFFDESDFCIKWKKWINSNKDVAILNLRSKSKFYQKTDNIFYENFIKKNSFYFKNAITYNDFINFFILKSNEENNKFQFVDNFDTNSRKLFFTSSKEPGKLVLSYPSELPNFDDNIDYFIVLDNLKNSFEPINKYLPLFIKNEIFKYFDDKNDTNGFVTLFEKLKEILNLADKNYQIYLHDLSLDKIKSDYKEYKQKYFASQNDILSKITTQVIALPISIAASAFSLYNLKGDIFPTLIVIFGLISYIIYVTFIVSIYFGDILTLNIMAQKDYKILKNHPFFIENTDELTYFNEIKDNIFDRLKSLKIGLNIFTFIMWISSICLVIYSLKMLSITINNLILPFLIVAFLFCLIYVRFLNKLELKNE